MSDLDRAPRSPAGARAPSGNLDVRDDGGERRHLTVMFCDLVDSTPMAGRLDPEDLRDLVHHYRRIAESAITGHGGRIAQFLGDGVLAYFGYPAAHEDDARRAVMAALDITARMQELGTEDLAARIAVHTGPVVVGGAPDGTGAPELTGLALNVAARLQSLAEPNTVIVSQSTADLVAGYVDLAPLGSFPLKGVDVPVSAYRPCVSHADVTRFDVAAARGLSPFVGREDDVLFLQDRWLAATRGRPATVVVLGDPGIGKSRLLWELRHRLEADQHDVIELQCSELHANTQLHPVVQHLTSRLAQVDGGSSQGSTDALESVLTEAGVPRQPALTLLGSLLELPVADDEGDLPEGIDMRRALLLQALRRLLIGSPGSRPLLIAAEDLQWADPTTLDLVGSLTGQDVGRPVLVLGTARTGFRTPWLDRPDVEVRRLARLDDTAAHGLVDWLIRRTVEAPLGDDVVATIVERSDGIPLFLEEVAALVADRAAEGNGTSTVVPTSLLDLLVSRVDRLGPAKSLLQAASLIGRDFDVGLLATIRDEDRDTTLETLHRPDVSELVGPAPGTTGETFTFRHALVRDAAYSTMLLRQRRRLHAVVARELIEDEGRGVPRFAGTPDVIAYHCREGGLLADAVHYLHLAATRSMSSGANAETVAFVDEALGLLDAAPADAGSPITALELLTLKGPALMAQVGYAHPTVAETFHRAKELLDDLGDRIELFPVLYGLVAYSAVRCELDTAAELAGRLRHSAEVSGDDGLTTLAHAASAQVDFIRGRFVSAAEHATVCIAHHDPVAQGDYRFVFGEDPGTICRGVACWLAWLRGDPEGAESSMDAALEAARSLDHAFTLAETLVIAARLHHYRGDVGAVRRSAEEALDLASRHGFPIYTAEGAVWCGWADAVEHGDPRGVERLRAGLAVFEESGWESLRAHHLTLLGEATWHLGDAEGALQALMAARAHARHHGDLDHQVEALRLSAVVSAHLGASADATSLLDEAAVLAAAQGARSLALRVAVTRSELARRAGDEAALERALGEVTQCLAKMPDGASSPEIEQARALRSPSESVHPAAPGRESHGD